MQCFNTDAGIFCKLIPETRGVFMALCAKNKVAECAVKLEDKGMARFKANEETSVVRDHFNRLHMGPVEAFKLVKEILFRTMVRSMELQVTTLVYEMQGNEEFFPVIVQKTKNEFLLTQAEGMHERTFMQRSMQGAGKRAKQEVVKMHGNAKGLILFTVVFNFIQNGGGGGFAVGDIDIMSVASFRKFFKLPEVGAGRAESHCAEGDFLCKTRGVF